MPETLTQLKNRFSEKLAVCRTIFNKKYRWVGFGALLFWCGSIWLWVNLLGVGFYFTIMIAMLIVNSFFSIKTCDTIGSLFKTIFPILIPIFCFIFLVIMVNPASLRLLAGLNPAELETANADIKGIVANLWLLAFSDFGKTTAPELPGGWTVFLVIYIAGFAMYTYGDAQDTDALKSIGALTLIIPIGIQFVLGFTYGKSYGLLGQVTEINLLLSYMGGMAGILSVLIGSIFDFMLVGVMFSIEHLIPEEEET